MKITTDDIGINVTWNRRPGYPLRRLSIATRCVLLLLALANLLSLASGMARGQLYLLSLAGVALASAAFLALRWSSARLCAITAERNRPRPDYRLIAAIELDVYGEAFHHDGAPSTAALEAQMDSLVEAAEKRAEPPRASGCSTRHPWIGELDGFGRAICGPCARGRQLARKRAMCDKGMHLYEISEPDCTICHDATWR